MERAAEPLLFFESPAEGGPPAPTDQSLAKRPRPPSEANKVRAIQVAPLALMREGGTAAV